MRVCDKFSKPKRVREQKPLGNTALLYSATFIRNICRSDVYRVTLEICAQALVCEHIKCLIVIESSICRQILVGLPSSKFL